MRRFVMLFAVALAVLTACVNYELRDSETADKLAGVDSQLEAVMAAIDLRKEVACVVGTVEGNCIFSDSYDDEGDIDLNFTMSF